jgi:hypothetical protein
VDQVGLKKAAESAASARSLGATKRDEEEPTHATPFLWWAMLGVGVVVCLVLLGTLIGRLLGDGEEPVEEFEETAVVERGAPEDLVPGLAPDGTDATDATDGAVPTDDGGSDVPPPAAGTEPVAVPPAPAPVDPTPAPAPAEGEPADGEPVDPHAAAMDRPRTDESVPGLPDVRPSDGDLARPRVTDGAAADWYGLVRHGQWIVVFARTPQAGALSSIRAANNLHRRLRDTGVNVLLVLPRKDFEDGQGALRTADEIQNLLAQYGATVDVRVLLDPSTSDAHGSAARGKWRVKRDVSAIYLAKGVLEKRTSPPDGAFTIDSLVDITRTALEAR